MRYSRLERILNKRWTTLLHLHVSRVQSCLIHLTMHSYRNGIFSNVSKKCSQLYTNFSCFSKISCVYIHIYIHTYMRHNDICKYIYINIIYQQCITNINLILVLLNPDSEIISIIQYKSSSHTNYNNCNLLWYAHTTRIIAKGFNYKLLILPRQYLQ